MDPVDLLTMSSQAAQAIRSAEDPEAVIAAGYSMLESDPAEPGTPGLASRIVRLMELAGDRRGELMEFFRGHARGAYLNRTREDWGGEGDGPEPEADPEAERLLEHIEEREEEALLMGDDSFSGFDIAERKASLGYFGGRTVIVRDGQRLDQEEAGELQAGDSIEMESSGLPEKVRCVLDYPFDVPICFTIEAGPEPWSVWDVCMAIADKYEEIYQNPGRYGVWGHDIGDLVIEALLYFPDENVIYPQLGS